MEEIASTAAQPLLPQPCKGGPRQVCVNGAGDKPAFSALQTLQCISSVEMDFWYHSITEGFSPIDLFVAWQRFSGEVHVHALSTLSREALGPLPTGRFRGVCLINEPCGES